jgi:peroxiredoxin Q/BCP
MLKKGDFLPEVELVDQKGEKRSFREFRGRPLVVYFYPKNNTPGCTAEACGFRDHYEEFTAHGAEVIGISGDSVSSHEATARKRQLPFVLMSDSRRKAEKAFGVPRSLLGLLPGRVTFIADGDGKIIHTFNSSTHIQQHIRESLEAIASLTHEK